MQITKVYLEKGYNLYSYNPSEISLTQIKSDTSLKSTYVLEIDMNDDGLNIKTVNLSILMTIFEAGKASTWEELLATLTPALIEAYAYRVPSMTNPEKAVRSISPMASPDFELSYLNLSVPEERNIKQFRYRLSDLGIKKTNSDNRFNLNNCLCFVNGLTSRPVMFNDEFLMKNGAKFMASTSEKRQPSTVLLDFSELGGFEIIPFSSCQKKFRNYTNLPDPETDMKIIFPEGIDLSQYTVFPVVGHTLFFPNRIDYLTSRSILFRPGLFRIEMSLLKQAACSNEYLERTFIYKTKDSVSNYILNTMFSPEHYGAFFVLIKNKKVLMSRSRIHNFCKSVEASLYNDGFLFERQTQSFMDYTRVDYDSIRDLYIHPLHKILHPDAQNQLDYQYALDHSKCDHVDTFKDYSVGGFELIKMISI